MLGIKFDLPNIIVIGERFLGERLLEK